MPKCFSASDRLPERTRVIRVGVSWFRVFSRGLRVLDVGGGGFRVYQLSGPPGLWVEGVRLSAGV